MCSWRNAQKSTTCPKNITLSTCDPHSPKVGRQSRRWGHFSTVLIAYCLSTLDALFSTCRHFGRAMRLSHFHTFQDQEFSVSSPSCCCSSPFTRTTCLLVHCCGNGDPLLFRKRAIQKRSFPFKSDWRQSHGETDRKLIRIA